MRTLDALLQRGGRAYAAAAFGEAREAYQAALDCGGRQALGAAGALLRIAVLENRLDEAALWLAASEAEARADAGWASWALEYALRRQDFAAAASYARRAGDAGAAVYWEQLARLETYRIEGASVESPLVTADPLPVIEARVNGRAARLLVDTAADHLLLDENFAGSCGARMAGVANRALFAGGSRALEDGWVDMLTLGGWSIGAVPAQILSLRPLFHEFAGEVVDGVLGMRLLSLFRVTLNYPQASLQLQARPGPAVTAGMPLWLAPGGLPVTSMILNGSHRTLGLIDSGCMGLGLAARAAVLHPSTPQQAVAAGGGGLTAIAPTRLRSLEAAGAVQQAVVAAALPDFPLAYRFGFCLDGFIGHEFLRRGVLELDFDCMRVLLDSSRDMQA